MAPCSISSTRVLIAVSAGRQSTRALPEAHAFAESLGAELHVLRVVSGIGAPSPPHDLACALRSAERVLAAARHTRALCDGLLEARLPSGRICVRLGTFTDQVARRAAELDAQLVILTGGARRSAARVIELARRTHCGVLVLKGSARIGTLIAATDPEDSRVERATRSVLVQPLGIPSS